MLSHELILNTHSSEDDRQTYIENLCSTNRGDTDSFGGKDEADFANVDRVFSLSHCVSSFIEGDTDHDVVVASEPIRLKWISKKRQSRCNRCMSKFTFFRRKHHCRVCGFVVCHKCSSSKIVLPQDVELVDGAQETNRLLPVRVCNVCKGSIEKQQRQEEQPNEIASSFSEIDDRVLLLLGDGGTGKSTGMHAIACKMSTNCVGGGNKGDGIQFVFIRPRVQEWSMESLRGVCSDICGGGGSLVFVLDGYDEVHGRSVDMGGESLPEYLGMTSTSRLIVTCRRNIVPDNRISLVFGGGVRVRYILPFTKNQISEYLEMCGAPQPSSPISNPFVLKLYSSSWQYLPSDQELKSARLVLKDIYDASVRAWFSEACGLDDELKSELSVKNFEDFACHVAMSMFIDGNRVATSFPSAPPPLQQQQNEDRQQVSSSPWFMLEDRVVECAAQLFDSRTSGDNARRSVMSRDDFIRNKLQLLTTQFLHKCPLQKKPGTQLFSFVHKSYRDYFCGMAMTRMMNVYIDKVLVTSDVAVQQWSSRFVDIAAARQHTELGSLSVGEVEESTFSIRALEFIEHTRHADPSPSLSIGGANCMTVLNTAGVPLSRRNFSGAQLGDTDDEENVIRRRSDQPFMDLGGAMLYGCDFSGANLSGARLQQACMDHVNFTQCNMSGVEFGQRPSFIGHSGAVFSLCVSPDGAYLYSGSADQTIKQWSVSSGELLRTMKYHSGDVSSLCISPDGAYLYSGSSDRTIKQWSVSSGELLRTMEGHSGCIRSLCVSPDGAYLYSGSDDSTITQWSVPSCELLRTMEGHGGGVLSLCVSPDGAYLYSGSFDETIGRWSVVSGELLRTMEGHSGGVSSLCISPDGAYLYTGSQDQTIKQWFASSGELLRTMQGHGGVSSLSVSPNGAYLYTGSYDHTIKQWSASSGELLRTMEGHGGDVLSLCISPNGAYVYSGSADQIVKQWSVSSGELLRTVEGHSGYVRSLCVSPDGAYLFSGSTDHTIKQWSVPNGELLRTMAGHRDGVVSLCVSPDGAYLYSGSADHSVKQWSVSSGELLRTMNGHSSYVLSLCISPDGTHLYSGSADHTIKQWSVSSGELLRTMDGHSGSVWSLCISPDGAYLCSGSADDAIKQWSVMSGELVSSRPGRVDVTPVSVGSNRIERSGSNVVEVGSDGTTILWSSPPFKLSARGATISDVDNLNDSDRRLLRQSVNEE